MTVRKDGKPKRTTMGPIGTVQSMGYKRALKKALSGNAAGGTRKGVKVNAKTGRANLSGLAKSERKAVRQSYKQYTGRPVSGKAKSYSTGSVKKSK